MRSGVKGGLDAAPPDRGSLGRADAMELMRLHDDRTSRGKCRGRIAAGHRKGQGKITGAEHGNRAQGDMALPQIRSWRPAIRHPRVNARFHEAALANDVGEQAQLTHGAGALAGSP